ncbi:MAG TPA: hemerythrin domain-containing protein [Kofleriaceae bacterium]|nr:hemerythrin domain-containing protein [Kofleriaceae bacterium]
MMFPIGKRNATDDPTEMVSACHERIRNFLTLADRLVSDEPATDDDVRGTAAAVARYFREALPQHERDEDDSIAPRVRGMMRMVDQALDDMHAQHLVMHPLVESLVAICDRIAAAAEAHVARAVERDDLARVLADLHPRMASHLAAEETFVFPAIEHLPFAERAALVGEMRARRVPIP